MMNKSGQGGIADTLTYKDETLKLKVKHSLVMFHPTNILITNAFSTENET